MVNMNSRVNTVKLADLSFIGYSLAGEETVIGVPELNVCFDIGRAPTEILNIDNVLLSHGHMDHAAGIAYYFSQRNFLDNRNGTMVVPKPLEEPIRRMMDAWIDIEGHRTPHRIVGIEAGQDYPIRRDLVARTFATEHAGPCLGYSVIEMRNKLRDEYLGLDGLELAKLRRSGKDITYTREVPLVCYCGDTMYGKFFDLPYVRQARVLILECTFIADDHRDRASAGNHMHIEDFVRLQDQLENEQILLVHLSRRTPLRLARHVLRERLSPRNHDRISFLMARPRRMDDASAPM
jgi:ribonuclease Z